MVRNLLDNAIRHTPAGGTIWIDAALDDTGTAAVVSVRDGCGGIPEDDLDQAARKMDQAEIRRLAVVEGGRLVGVLSHGNLVQATGGKGAAEKATVGVTRGA